MIKLENISFDHCIKCTVCTVYCPVAKVTHLFPGPKQSGPDAERLRIKNPALVDSSLKYCTNCKRCEIACPSDVKIADIIQEAKWHYGEHHFNPRNFLLSRMDLMGRMLSPFSAIVNYFMGLTLVKFFMDKTLGIAQGRTFPRFQSGSFRKWFEKEAPEQSIYPEQVVYFHGCSVNNMDHELGKDLVKVLNAMNIGVNVPKQKCCGVPAIANGDVKRARKNAKYNINSLSTAVAVRNQKIVQTCSSGTYALKYEYRNFLKMNNDSIYENIEYITQFLHSKFEKGHIPKMNPLHMRVAYHSPCHLERTGGVLYTIDMLKRIPGLDLVILHSECCGLSGTYGFKSEYFRISKDVGAELFKRIDQANPEIVVTDCVTCKWQIENFTPYRVVHPLTLLAQALA